MGDLLSLEETYWKISNQLDLFEYLIPTNLSDEKRTFLENVKKGTYSDPKFAYKKIAFDISGTVKLLEELQNDFRKTGHTIGDLYIEMINDDIAWISQTANRETSSFNKWLSGLFGKPSEQHYSETLHVISEQVITEPGCDLSSEKMGNIISEYLKSVDITDWKIEFRDISSRLAINSAKKVITVNEHSLFSKTEVDRLIIHELNTHVLRRENGSRQHYLIFKNGFPDYLETEEGLAIWAEKVNGLLSSKDLTKYCARLIACYQCFEASFVDIFMFISKYLNENDTFDIVARVKRGLTDTSETGGFTKDQIYYTGLKLIESLSLEDIKKLYMGKIGVQDINTLSTISNLTNKIITPEWLDSVSIEDR